MVILLLFLTSHQQNHTACLAENLQRRMLSPQHHRLRQVCFTMYNTASGYNAQNNSLATLPNRK